jgi:hypothetical protein
MLPKHGYPMVGDTKNGFMDIKGNQALFKKYKR